MKVAGIDCSTMAIDLVLLDLDSDRAEWISFDLVAKMALIDRLRRVGDILGRTSTIWDDVTAIGIERPMKRGHGSSHSAMAFGATLTRLPDWVLVKEWTPSEWRVGCGLGGRASKAEVAEWGKDLLVTPRLWSQDAYDALAIAYATRSALETVPSIDPAPAQSALTLSDTPTPSK